MSQEPSQLDYSNLQGPSPLRVLLIKARENILTTVLICAILSINLVLAVLAIPLTVFIGGLIAPGINWLLAAFGLMSLPWVWSRSSEKVFTAHALLAVLLPYICNLAVWKIACAAYPH